MMFGVPVWLIKWGAVALLIGVVWFHGRSVGRDQILQRLKNDRITILKDGKQIDDKVESADVDELCRILGGCVRDGTDSNPPM